MSDSSLLERLDSLPKVRRVLTSSGSLMHSPRYGATAYQTQSSYQRRSAHGGVVTVVLSLILLVLLWGDVYTFLAGERTIQFKVYDRIDEYMQLNLDMTVNMPCQCAYALTVTQVNIRDAAGDREMVTDADVAKDGTFFADLDIGDTVHEGRKRKVVRNAQRSGKYNPRGPSGFPKTYPRVSNGPACRIYGSIMVKRVTGNLHITAAGHGYWSPIQTPPGSALRLTELNLTHVIHELSFGPFFPRIVEPLDASVEIAKQEKVAYQYYLSVVPTRYIATSGSHIDTNQYSVTDYVRELGPRERMIPGIFIKYDVEPIALVIRARSISWLTFLVRTAGVIGGLWVCTGMALRVIFRAYTTMQKLPAGSLKVTSSEDVWPENSDPGYGAGYSGTYDASYGSAKTRTGYTGLL